MEYHWHRVGTRQDIETRRLKRVRLNRRWIALLYWQGQIYAIQDNCPHRGASLADGPISEDGYIECVLHGWEYHVGTGQGRGAWAGCVVCFPLEELDGDVYLGFQEPPEVEEEDWDS